MFISIEHFVYDNTTLAIGVEQSNKNKCVTTTISKWFHKTLKMGFGGEMASVLTTAMSVLYR